MENLEGIFFLSNINCAIVLKLKWMGCMDRFDAYIRLRICIQVLACNVLVHYGVSSGQIMQGFCTVSSACIMELAGIRMELAYTHLEFHIAIVLAM